MSSTWRPFVASFSSLPERERQMVGFSESDRSAIAFAQRFQRCVMGHVEVQRRHADEAVLHRLQIGMVSGGGNRLAKAKPVIIITAGVGDRKSTRLNSSH